MCSKIKTALKISNPPINTSRSDFKSIKLGSNEFSFDYVLTNNSIDKIVLEFIDNIFDDSSSTLFTYGAVDTGKSHTLGTEFFSNLNGFITKSLVELFVRIENEEKFFNKTKHTVRITLCEIKDNKCNYLIYPTLVENLYKTIMLLDQPIEFQYESHVVLSVAIKRKVSNIEIFERNFNFIDLGGGDFKFLKEFFVKKFELNKPVKALEQNYLVKKLNKFFNDSKVLLIACVDLSDLEESYETIRFATRFTQAKNGQVLDETIEWTIEDINQSVEKKQRSNETVKSFASEENVERRRDEMCDEPNKSVYDVNTPLPCIKLSQCYDSIEFNRKKNEDVKESTEIRPQRIEELEGDMFEWTLDESKETLVLSMESKEKRGEKRKCDDLDYEQLKKKFRSMTIEIGKIIEDFGTELESI